VSSSVVSTSGEDDGQRHFSYTKMTLDGNFHFFCIFFVPLFYHLNDTAPFCSIRREVLKEGEQKNAIFYSRPERSGLGCCGLGESVRNIETA